jgi:hypothetical protein
VHVALPRRRFAVNQDSWTSCNDRTSVCGHIALSRSGVTTVCFASNEHENKHDHDK